jgi:hypothetical protein
MFSKNTVCHTYIRTSKVKGPKQNDENCLTYYQNETIACVVCFCVGSVFKTVIFYKNTYMKTMRHPKLLKECQDKEK